MLSPSHCLPTSDFSNDSLFSRLILMWMESYSVSRRVNFFLIIVVASCICVVRFISGVGGSDVFIPISAFRFFYSKKREKEFLASVGSEARSLLLPALRGPRCDRVGQPSPLWPQLLCLWRTSCGCFLGSLLVPALSASSSSCLMPIFPPHGDDFMSGERQAGGLIRLRRKEEPDEAGGRVCHHTDP